MEEYLTYKQLSARVQFAEGTLRNMVSNGVFQKEIHYLKPTSRKVLFIWSRVEAWLCGKENVGSSAINNNETQTNCLINI